MSEGRLVAYEGEGIGSLFYETPVSSMVDTTGRDRCQPFITSVF